MILDDIIARIMLPIEYIKDSNIIVGQTYIPLERYFQAMLNKIVIKIYPISPQMATGMLNIME
ncbi:hypothetical protein DSCOOX_00790 [Desulfosarcina ovata subsp. ovata]|uniref:Uncharacterized protein n=1 Tax=Desulfosarcina ovata subsp. ovata TaxID=2752305 RepID=A0A5K8A2Z7_9BACT|nr:hypothetical protein DSCOOX_00790 [Desulfosarcina ovata subsp. ovata]